ncbi:uncharacterized protein LOC132256312 [Phlebotomus argentipes]|uniref:uncharacterized protein LOC132256312 n=1 Tax=Phlebotomus argentipes TaxID=94469 RepID=UPI002893659F|nr:uncharacterized protein LOC132256312 [Phlebotomus argentipes]XP_059608636.1 uncharacterized protein LOC132256312 [Phlebotomus argentipes]
MSTGLMSCVRENSPPLEGVSIQQDDGDGGFSHSPEPPETHKRRRFHPLRNLRRIFRRRTVPRGDFVGHGGDNCSSIPSGGTSQMVNSSDSSSPPSIVDVTASGSVTSGGYTTTIYLTKERLEGNLDMRSGRIAKMKEAQDELDRDITDYQRSFSEGLLVDSGYNRDALSQSHDSVFSESATASSLSIVLKAELVDVLRKRRIRPDASDEDLGLPHSPTTPQRKDYPLNHSEGSLSLLSMVSSDMEPEPYAILSGSSATAKRSLDIFQVSEEHDLNLSIGSKLSHSAARHKMAVRPNKKKGPSRHRKTIEMKAAVLPVTPELNEDAAKTASREALDKKVRSKSLPPGVNSKMMEQQSSNCLQSSGNMFTSSTESSSSTIYVNPQLSKSYAFEKETLESVSSEERQEEMKKLSNGSMENVGERVKMRQPRTGAASRQRIQPKDLSFSPEVSRSTKICIGDGAEMPKVCDYLPRSEPKISSTEKLFAKSLSQGISVKCRDTVTPIRGNDEDPDAMAPPPKVVWPDSCKSDGMAKTVDVRKSPRRKSVEKSKSFRFYSENDPDKLSQSHLPSLPDLSLTAFDDKTSLGTRRNSLKYTPSMKFEINDNNLVKPKEELHHFEGNSCGKNIILTPNKMGNATNISQIEENIDKLVKSTFVTVLKKSPNNCTEVVEAKIRHTSVRDASDDVESVDAVKNRRSAAFVTEDDPKVPEFMKIQLNRVDSTRPKSHVVLSKNVKEDSTRRHSTEILDTTKVPVATAEEKKSPVKVSPIVSPTKTAPKRGFPESEPVIARTTEALNEVKTLIAERRLSVSDEKAKIERRLSVSDDSKNERNTRKSSEDSGTICSTRKASSDDENIVVLRKKSSSSSTKEDNTPELMKVFARRSLKLKDTDEMQLYDQLEKGSIGKTPKSANVDSDKENQSSSEEKLDRLAKVEPQIVAVTNGNYTKPPSGREKSGSIEEKATSPKKCAESCDNYRKSSLITPKPFATNSPNRFSGTALNYRSTPTTFHDIRKSLGVAMTTLEATSQANQANINNNNNNSISNGVCNNNNPTTNGRHTIAAPQSVTTDENTDASEEDICEFKGILQRRAEWEKRAKDACK